MTIGNDYKVVCYYESWAIYRQEPMTTSPADVDPYGCTHVIYSFVGLDKKSYTVTILDPDYEVIRGKLSIDQFFYFYKIQSHWFWSELIFTDGLTCS